MTFFELAALSVTAVAAVCDLRTGRIPNWLTLGTLAVGLVAHSAVGAFREGLTGFAESAGAALGGVLVCGAAPALVFFRGGIGGGDVKLFAGLGALCLARDGLLAELYSFVIAAVVAPAILAYEGKLLRTLGSTLVVALNPFRRREARRDLPRELMTWFRLAPAIFLGTSAMVALSY